MHEDGAVDRLGAAVNVEHGGVALRGVVVLRQQHPAADLRAAAADAERPRLGNVFVLQRLAVEIAQARELTAGQIEAVELLQAHIVERDEQGLVPGGVKAVNAAGPGEDRRVAAVGGEAVQHAVPLPGGQMQEAAAVFRRLASAAEAAVAPDGAVHAVLLLAQHAECAAVRIDAVDPGVFVEAEAIALGPEEPELPVHGLQAVEGDLLVFEHSARLAAAPVIGAERKALERLLDGAALHGVKQLAAQQAAALQILRQLREGLDGEGLLRHDKEPVA